ncbi:MAG: hypothetical protein RO469_16915 [Thermincola sp.]|nr:hypothetical protein [Thermincola sp.]MDT3703315.1 hypothetical protein [Thermincola sp.]
MQEQDPTTSQEQGPVSGNDDLVRLWQEMGASTGSLLGRIIGLTAQYGLTSYQQNFVKPLQEYSSRIPAAPPEPGVAPDVRQQTWREMGREYGEMLGNSIGMTMDLMIKTLENGAQSSVPGYNQQTDGSSSQEQE